MPNEPDHDIDKLLKAYAQKRRQDADAGAPREMHAATRHLLQAEVARAFRGHDHASRSTSWSGFWFRFASAGTVLLILAAAIFVQTDKNPVPPVELTRNRESERFSSTAPQTPFSDIIDGAAAPEPTPQLGALALQTQIEPAADRYRLSDAVSTEPGEKLRESESLARLDRDKLPAPSPSDDRKTQNVESLRLAAKSPVNDQLANATAEPADAPQLAAAPKLVAPSAPAPAAAGASAAEPTLALRRNESPPLAEGESQATPLGPPAISSSEAKAKNVTSTPATLEDRGLTEGSTIQPTYFKAVDAQLQANPVTFNFSQVDPPARSRRYSAAPPKTGAVLNSFQVQQSGNNLSIVDADGSVYQGTFEATAGPEGASRTESGSQEPAAGRGLGQSQLPSFNRSTGGRMGMSAAENLSFRAVGTNRSLQQQVIFTGNVIPAASAQTNAGRGGFGGGGGRAGGASPAQTATSSPAAPAPLPSLPWGRIEGQAIVGGTNQLTIQAIRTGP